MLLTIEKMIILKSIKLFSEVSQNDLLSLATHVNEIEYTKGDMIIQQGDLGTSMYIIVNGEVDVVVDGNNVATLGEKEVFGELAALDPEPRSATILANSDVLLFKIESSVIYDLISVYQNVAKAIIGILCQRIRQK
ncbi:MAG: cyclic nucleotide-binding domain-containing protein [Campylobacterota bacterium]|nr:cyclic nucleotide-binding domain-containing protein [Campylobacterota bacterium]